MDKSSFSRTMEEVIHGELQKGQHVAAIKWIYICSLLWYQRIKCGTECSNFHIWDYPTTWDECYHFFELQYNDCLMCRVFQPEKSHGSNKSLPLIALEWFMYDNSWKRNEWSWLGKGWGLGSGLVSVQSGSLWASPCNKKTPALPDCNCEKKRLQWLL